MAEMYDMDTMLGNAMQRVEEKMDKVQQLHDQTVQWRDNTKESLKESLKEHLEDLRKWLDE